MSESLYNKVSDLHQATLMYKRIRHKCFPMNFAKILRAPIL